MSDLVIDASVAVKWVIEEVGTIEALALRDLALTAPDVLIAECANILLEKGPPQRPFGARGGVRCRSSGSRRHRSGGDAPYLETAVRIALALDHPAYDCLYIALAEAEGLRFVTADTSLVRKPGLQASRRDADRVLGLTDAAIWQE